MEKERLAVLRSKLKAQEGEIRTIYGKIEERRQTADKAHLESLAYQLHNLYCAFEDLFKMIAGAFENQIEEKDRYHLELLKRMVLTIEGVRPGLLSQESHRLLDNLRAFRHFFRHAYSYELDDRKVRLVLEDANRLKGLYSKEIDHFLDQLETG
jgi:uncharacterized protein YutE (UPF0331/DUF86 family)